MQCLERVYSRGGKHECPLSSKKGFYCNKSMFRNDWRDQTFEDVALEREIDIRRRVFKM
jgi:hypothetical protein